MRLQLIEHVKQRQGEGLEAIVKEAIHEHSALLA